MNIPALQAKLDENGLTFDQLLTLLDNIDVMAREAMRYRMLRQRVCAKNPYVHPDVSGKQFDNDVDVELKERGWI